MTLPIDPETGPLIAAGLVGVINVEAGPTDEQWQVFQALSRHLLGIDPQSVQSMASASPAELAASIPDSSQRRIFVQMAIILEMCRHPRSETQLLKLEEYTAAVHVHGPQLDAVRDLAHKSAEQATGDFLRIYDRSIPELTEPRFQPDSGYVGLGIEELCAQVQQFETLPHGTLGREFIDFYERSGLTVPSPNTPQPGYYVCHDMNHVITGYEATGPAEIALGAFKLMLNNSDANWMASMVNLLIHEVGLFKHASSLQFVPYGRGGEPYHGLDGSRGALSMSGAPELVAEAFVRGSACTADFSEVDHLAMAHLPLVEVRERFHVIPLRHSMRPGEDAGLWPNFS
jgi:hypothetical protein